MFDDLNPFFQILFEKGGEGGGGGGGGQEGPDTQESAVAQNNSDIKEITKSISEGEGEGEGSGKDPMSRHIGYFEEDLGIEGEGGEGEDPDPDPDPEGGQEGETIFEADDDLGEGEDPDPDLEAGEGEGEGEDPKVPEGKEDFFYVPERDAEGRDPYPNEFETRMDAQFAVSEKIQTFDDYAEKLEEAGSQVGAAIDPQVQEKIEKYRDLDYPNQVDDDTLRADIVDLDEGLKAVKLKVDRVQGKAQKQKTQKEAEKNYIQAEKKAQKSSQEIGLPDRLNELPENADKDDLMELVDDQIQSHLTELDQQIQQHQADEEYLDEHGLQAYNQRLNELQEQRREKATKLSEHRQNIESWWDSQQQYRAAKDKNTELTEAEKAKKVDQAFLEFQEDRSQGPNALDIFTKSKDTKPIVHFRQYALSPANRDKFDLTTPQGWIKAHADWKAWVNENVQAKKNGKQKKKNSQKSKSGKRKPIPSPERNRGSQIIPNGTNMDGLRQVNSDISKLSKSIMRGQ